MTTIQLNKKTYSVPTTWNELTAKQVVKVVDLLSRETDVHEGYLRLLKILTGMSWWRFINTKAERFADFFYLVEFLVKENTLTKNLLPKYRGFVGAADDFENLLMCEFAYTEDFFLRWKEDETNETLLNQLVAVLYRKPKRFYNERTNKDGDARQPFNEYLSRYHAGAAIGSWPLKTKRAIAVWYDGCRTKMMKDFPNVFNGSGGEPAKYGLVSIMRNVAEKGVHGNFKEVEKLHVRMVMLELDEMMTEVQKIKQQSNG
ncbi:MAG: hypothetical protein EOO14_02530 [Chitinophagaceae bacterium]|nr:MAG: hypothetical protein EOO14_02530 [Chitinophagaceae bacterium]